jgi:hypothetical protein
MGVINKSCTTMRELGLKLHIVDEAGMLSTADESLLRLLVLGSVQDCITLNEYPNPAVSPVATQVLVPALYVVNESPQPTG